MKILHLANFYHSQSGGIRTYLDNKRDHFAAAGLPFRLVVPGEIDGLDAGPGDTLTYRIGSLPAPFNPDYRLIWNYPALMQIVMRERPQLIEVNDKYTLAFLSWYYRKVAHLAPTVGFHHERLDNTMVTWFGDRPPVRQIAAFGMKLACAAFDKIICASRYTAEEIMPIAPDKVEIINLGTDLSQFSPDFADPALRRSHVNGSDLLLLYVGRLAREKNLALLPRMLDRLRERGVRARLLVAGVGQDSHLLECERRQDIRQIGFVQDRREMARLMASADLLVFPSRQEPFGLAPLEALASGLPVVCSDEGGVAEYCGSAAVRSVPPTAERFAEAISGLLNEDRPALRREARRHALTFSWETTFARQMNLYETLLSEWRVKQPRR